jgi:hypothetical protein
MTQIERIATVVIACVALFAGAAFGVSRFDRAEAAPVGADVKQLKLIRSELEALNTSIGTSYADHGSVLYLLHQICGNTGQAVYCY